jgi:hypothetical protein
MKGNKKGKEDDPSTAIADTCWIGVLTVKVSKRMIMSYSFLGS